jgi:2-haloacid dehalogenase
VVQGSYAFWRSETAETDPLIFKLFLETFAIDPALTVYIDDRAPNVEAAIALGMRGILFTDAPALRTELIGLGLFH